MGLICSHRTLVFFVMLLFGAGHAHQVFGRFVTHHHDAECVLEHHAGDEERHHNGDSSKDAEHMDEHASLAGVVPPWIAPMIVTLHSMALVDVSPVEMPEAPVAGIDHPPQLIG